jgi:hypothetical protein
MKDATDICRTESGTPESAARSGNVGCLAGIGIAMGLPVIVFCGILIANAMNPRCGTPADSGGCEMGLAAGTIAATVIGLALGILVTIIAAIARPRSRTTPRP